MVAVPAAKSMSLHLSPKASPSRSPEVTRKTQSEWWRVPAVIAISLVGLSAWTPGAAYAVGFAIPLCIILWVAAIRKNSSESESAEDRLLVTLLRRRAVMQLTSVVILIVAAGLLMYQGVG